MHRVDVDLVAKRREIAGHHLGGVFEYVLFARDHRCLGHPNQHRIKLLLRFWQVTRLDDHITTTGINFILESQRNRHWRCSFLEIAIKRYDFLDLAFLS